MHGSWIFYSSPVLNTPWKSCALSFITYLIIVSMQVDSGIVLPDKASLYLTAIEDAEYKDDKIECELSWLLKSYYCIFMSFRSPALVKIFFCVYQVGKCFPCSHLCFQSGIMYMASTWAASRSCLWWNLLLTRWTKSK